MSIIFQHVANTLCISFVFVMFVSVAKNILQHNGQCVIGSPISQYYNKKRLYLAVVTITTIFTFYVFSSNFESFMLTSNWKTTLLLGVSSAGFVFGMMFVVIISFQIVFATRKGIFKIYIGD